MKAILETKNLTKKYGQQYAVKNINIHLVKGQIYGLVGRNGAGKTTILKIISGLANATEGTFELSGSDGDGKPLTRKKIGCLIENPGVYPNMTAKENLTLKCLALGVNDAPLVDQILAKVGLENTGRKKVGKFSLGMKQRLGIALALIGDPEIVVLDEPVNGLDPQGIVEVRETIEKLNRENGITFIISSHLLDELSKIANKYGIIHNGQLLTELTAEELEDKCSKKIELRVEQEEKAGQTEAAGSTGQTGQTGSSDKTNQAVTVLNALGIQNYIVTEDGKIQIFEWLERTGEISMALCKAGIPVIELVIKNETLENFYLNMTGGIQNA